MRRAAPTAEPTPEPLLGRQSGRARSHRIAASTRVGVVYLAGPDVFLPEAAAIRDAKKRLCAEYGLVGLHPFDNELPAAAPNRADLIYAANLGMMRRADAGVFNLTPFRGPSADVGTAFELGFMTALGKPVFGYSAASGCLRERVTGARYDAAARVWRDDCGCVVEDFGLSDNLMVAQALDGATVARTSGADALFARAFRDCLQMAVASEGRRRST